MMTVKTSLLALALIICACTAPQTDNYGVGTRSGVSKSAAIETAKREVIARHLPLPKHWKGRVRDTFADLEFRPSYRLLAITIYATEQGSERDYYEVNVNAVSGAVEDFLDVRHRIPARLR